MVNAHHAAPCDKIRAHFYPIRAGIIESSLRHSAILLRVHAAPDSICSPYTGKTYALTFTYLQGYGFSTDKIFGAFRLYRAGCTHAQHVASL